jgi:hypothetical protein
MIDYIGGNMSDDSYRRVSTHSSFSSFDSRSRWRSQNKISSINSNMILSNQGDEKHVREGRKDVEKKEEEKRIQENLQNEVETIKPVIEKENIVDDTTFLEDSKSTVIDPIVTSVADHVSDISPTHTTHTTHITQIHTLELPPPSSTHIKPIKSRVKLPRVNSDGGEEIDNNLKILTKQRKMQKPESITSKHALLNEVEPAFSTPFLVIILSTNRPGGQDYVSDLVHSLLLYSSTYPNKIRIIIYNADRPTDPPLRPYIYELGVEVLNAPKDGWDQKLSEAEKIFHVNKEDGIEKKRWQTKNDLDYIRVLEFAYQQKEKSSQIKNDSFIFPYIITLEDDVWANSQIFHRTDRLIRRITSPSSTTTTTTTTDSTSTKNRNNNNNNLTPREWFALTLFHTRIIDGGKRYQNGDDYDYHACSQGLC